MKMEDMPEIISASHISKYLHVSRNRIYELFQIKPEYGGIPCFTVGTQKRVLKSDFEKWIDDRKRTNIRLKAVK